MSYEKKHGVGNVVVDIPYAHFIHELPLLSFGDVQHNINVSLIFQTKEQNNLFSISSGFKLNLQKRIIMSSEGVPEKYEDGNGKRITLNNCNNRFVLTDGSQRIIRPVGTTYVLENSDYSREVYENTGRIQSVWDKYGNRYLTYIYVGNHLDCINYRNKTIRFNYNGSPMTLNSLQYVCNDETICTTTFSYPEEGSIIVHHYSGMDYHLTYSSSELEVCSIDTDEVYSNQKPHRLHCKRSIKSLSLAELNFVKKIGSEIIDETTYNCYICDESIRFDAMDVIDYNGVKTRIQFDGEKPIYSYEVRDDMFREVSYGLDYIYPSTYFGTVTYYSNGQVAGIQEYNDGIKLAFNSHFNNWLGHSTDGYDTTNIKYVVLSGWLRREQDLTSNQLNISYSDMRPNTDRTFDMGELPLGRWVYFSKTIETTEIDSPAIEFDHYWDSSKLLTKDFRITPYYENTSNNASRIPDIENFLVLHDANGNETCNIPLNPKPDKQANDDEQPKTSFYNGDTELDSSTYQITVSDIIRYKINQAYGAHLNEIYYNNCCALIPNAGVLKVKYTDANRSTPIINVQDATLETRRSVRGNVYTTRIKINSNADIASGLIIKSIRNGHFYNQDFYDVNYLDLKSSYKDKVNVFYGRNNYGLITYQRISNNDGVDLSYTQTEYDPDCTKVVKTVDEFGQVTTYVTDDVWGVVTEAQLGEEGTAVKNTYDGDMSAILAKRFVKGDAQRVHTFDYSKGYCSEISDGVLTYNFENGFTDTAEEYSNVSKCNRLIESYTRNPRTREVTEAFISADDTEYSWYRAYDVYGKLINVVGAFTNKYDVAPECRQGDACATGIDNASSKLASSKDLKTGKETKYAYEKGRVSKVGVFDSTDNMIEEETYTYDNKGRLLKDDYIFDKNGNKSVSSEIDYHNPNEDDPVEDNRVYIYTYDVNGEKKADTFNFYDSFKRINQKDVTLDAPGFCLQKFITYEKTRVSEVADKYRLNQANLGTTEYDYDPYGRIEKITYVSDTTASQETTYQYDDFGQLIRENNEALDKTYVYEYNSIGNITKVKNYHYRLIDPLTNCSTDTEYTYDTTHPDRLIAIDGNSITYNSLGGVETYKGKRYDWERGRLVKVRQGNKNAAEGAYEECTFTYDGYGRRMQKSYLTGYNYPAEDAAYNSSTTNTIDYTYDNSGRLIRELRTNVIQYGTTTTTTRELIYLYDESGMIGVMLNSQPYYYHRNLQGDVIAIYDANGEKQVEYAYDAWGNCETVYGENDELAYLNPIRYRGYYYDTETKLYYLNARYYSPEWRRFISPDAAEYIDPETPNGLNLYVYCYNDPVNYVDPSGHSSESFWKTFLGISLGVGLAVLAVGATIITGGSFAAIGFGFVAGAAASLVGQGIGNAFSGENFFDGISISSIIMGGLAGAAFATGVGGLWGAAIIGAASNAGASALENKSWTNVVGSAIVGGIAAGVGYGVGRLVANQVFKHSGMTFNNYFNLGRIDRNAINSAIFAFGASMHTFLPSIATSSSRGLIKALGNMGIGGF